MKVLAFIGSCLFSFVLYLIGGYSVLIYPLDNFKLLDNKLDKIIMIFSSVVIGALIIILSTCNWIQSKDRYDRHKSINSKSVKADRG